MLMFANRISSSTSCSIWLPETSPPSSARGLLRDHFQSCNTSLDTNKIANPVEVGLRIGPQVVVEQDQHPVLAKTRAPIGQMPGVAGHFDHLRNFYEELIERKVRKRVVTPEFICRVDSLDRIAKRADDFALRNMQRDALGGLGEAEVWIDLANRTAAVGIAKVMRVPLESLVIVGGEEIGLLDSGRQIDAALEDFMKPRRAGPARSDRNEIGQSQVTSVI